MALFDNTSYEVGYQRPFQLSTGPLPINKVTHCGIRLDDVFADSVDALRVVGLCMLKENASFEVSSELIGQPRGRILQIKYPMFCALVNVQKVFVAALRIYRDVVYRNDVRGVQSEATTGAWSSRTTLNVL